ncbi:MAG: hypothetical protein JJU18_05530 [Oceanicaulis sp.]|nr:hypothetical protein [Oceanicaulis sp.]
MRGWLIGLTAAVIIAGGVLGLLLVMAESGAPEPQEMRVEVGDELGL